MKIISNLPADKRTIKTNPGSYEWWYFDAISNDNSLSFAIIFYEGNPFSGNYIKGQKSDHSEFSNRAEYYPALSISIYQYGKPVYYGFVEHKREDAHFESESIKGKVGDSSFSGTVSGSELIYNIELNQKLPGGDFIRASLKFSSENNFPIFPEQNIQNRESTHVWNMVQPRAGVTGKIEIDVKEKKEFIFDGTGYHDHNLGMEPMKNSFKNWYWGRFHFHDRTLIYYIMNKQGNEINNAWIIDDEFNVLPVNKKIILNDKGYNVFGLRSARQIELTGSNHEIYIQQAGIVDDGPFYQRFLSRAVMHVNNDILQTQGISEFIAPERIYSKLFRPIVNMRISYPDNSHWLQKKPKLFRMTW
ncbi:MAG: hypothetical protein ACFCU6_01340 [Balneolaceae bacterium]